MVPVLCLPRLDESLRDHLRIRMFPFRLHVDLCS